MQQLNEYTLLIPNFNDTFVSLFQLPSESQDHLNDARDEARGDPTP